MGALIFFGALVVVAIVLVFAGGTYAELERWELLLADLGDARPGLICTAITPFGLTGPNRDFLDSEIVVTALSGIGYYVPGPPGGISVFI